MVCLLPISFLSKVLVPWAEELGEVTTEAGAAPPGDATVTDASKDDVWVDISDPSNLRVGWCKSHSIFL